MTELTKELKRWDELTPHQRDALVAVRVMGWDGSDSDIVEWDDSDNERIIPNWEIEHFHDDRGEPAGEWNPTTDRNDLHKAVKAFKQSANLLCSSKMSENLYYALSSRQCSTTEMHALLLDPSDVCRAMLQALAESERNHE